MHRGHLARLMSGGILTRETIGVVRFFLGGGGGWGAGLRSA